MQKNYRTPRKFPHKKNPYTKKAELDNQAIISKKFISQSFFCFVIFALAYILSYANTPIKDKVKNEITYTLMYTPKWQDVYYSVQNSVSFVAKKMHDGIDISSVFAPVSSEGVSEND